MTEKKPLIINGVYLEDVKDLLRTGHKMSITTATFEKIIDCLEEKFQECEELKAKLINTENDLAVEIQARLYHMTKDLENRDKLRIATEALHFYADMEETRETKEQGSDRWIYVVDDNYGDLAQQALKDIGDVN